MTYIPNTHEDRLAMLEAIGIKDGDVEKLFNDIPRELRARSFDIPPGKSEYEVTQEIKSIALKNKIDHISFLGGGYYDHFIPAAVDALSSRSEFYTAYTPYQAEASQGTLQAIYEYQSAIARLTDMEVSNASLYDGATAIFEAAMMAMRVTGKNKIIADSGVSPIFRKILYSYTSNLSIEFEEIPVVHGQSDRDKVAEFLDDKTAAIILQNPNFFGAIDDYTDIIKMTHNAGAVAIMSVYPISLGMLKTPGEMGADIVTGEGQSLGMPLSFGGPYLGFMATKKRLVRKMPGRLVGATTDADGNRGFVLTLQTREQHVRREKATSNICSNGALCALRAVIYLSLLGKEGLKELAEHCFKKTEYLKKALSGVKKLQVKQSSPTFNEFTVRLPYNAQRLITKMQDKGFIAGLALGQYYKGMDDYMLIAVTEKHTKQQLDQFVKTIRSVI